MPGTMETLRAAAALSRVPPSPGRERDREPPIHRPAQVLQMPSCTYTLRWGLGAVVSVVQVPALPRAFHTSVAAEERRAHRTRMPFAFTSQNGQQVTCLIPLGNPLQYSPSLTLWGWVKAEQKAPESHSLRHGLPPVPARRSSACCPRPAPRVGTAIAGLSHTPACGGSLEALTSTQSVSLQAPALLPPLLP